MRAIARAAAASAAFASIACSAWACTLLVSRDGLAGAPVERDAASDAGADTATQDAGADAFDAAAPRTLYDRLDTPIGLALAGDRIWFVATQPRGLLRAPKSGAGPVVHADEPGDLGTATPFDLAVDGADLYFGELDTGIVWKKPVAGGAKQHCFDGAPRAAYMTFQSGALFVTDFRLDGTGTVVRGTCASPSGEVFFAGVPRASGIAGAGASLYFGRNGPDAIFGGSIDGGAPSAVKTVVGAVGGVATDGVALYFLLENRRLARMRLDTRVVETLYEADAPFGDGDVAVDDTNVYWSESQNQRIRVMPK